MKKNEININDLRDKGYIEEKEWRDLLWMPFRFPLGCGILMFISSFIVLIAFSPKAKNYALILMASGLGTLATSIILMRVKRPKSPITGKRLIKYYNTHPDNENDRVEIIYVDNESKKYFTQVFIRRGDDAP